MAGTIAQPSKGIPSPSRRPAKGGKGKIAAAIIGLGLVAALGTAAAVLLPGRSGPPTATPEAFAEQMESAARSPGPPLHHVYGGTIRAERNGATLALVADKVPSAACVSVGWKLVRKGLLSINGTMPLRVSAGKLSELCSQEEGGAVLTWIPRRPDSPTS